MNTPQKSLKDVIKEQYQKCAGDPVYFMKKYCKIQHPIRGKIPFELYPFQEDTLTNFKEHRYNIVLKSRQLGISTLVAGYALWKMIFNEDFNVLIIANKQDVAKNLVLKVRTMNQLLPVWLRVAESEDNKLSLRLKNGSQVKAVSSKPDSGRSEALSLLVFDEAAFIDYICVSLVLRYNGRGENCQFEYLFSVNLKHIPTYFTEYAGLSTHSCKIQTQNLIQTH